MRTHSNVFRLAQIAFVVLAVRLVGPWLVSSVAAADWRIDPARTTIAFAIDAAGFPRTEGRFRQFDGRISVDFSQPSRSSVAFHVRSQSVDVGSSAFNDYVRSPAFLDSAKYPSIDFVSTSVQQTSDHSVRVSGELTLLGVTKPLTVDVTVARETAGSRPRLEFRVVTRINRVDFGMNSGFPLVSRDVELTISSAARET